MTDETPLAQRLRQIPGGLTKSEAAIAQWLALNAASLGNETGASVAAKTGVSEITVSRFLKRAGFKGLAGLKEELQSAHLAQVSPDHYFRLPEGEIGSLLKRDAEAVLALAAEVEKPAWAGAIQAIAQAQEVHVTGFQSIRGIAEDFARRLAIVRGGVRFLSPHDDGLTEWLPPRQAGVCLVMVDMAPYAREALPILRLARSLGMAAVVVSDELNTWAAAETPFVFHVQTKVDAFLESTGPMTTLMNVILHAVALRAPQATEARIAAWLGLLRGLDLY